jgi:tRNA-dihydrouridine synthase A
MRTTLTFVVFCKFIVLVKLIGMSLGLCMAVARRASIGHGNKNGRLTRVFSITSTDCAQPERYVDTRDRFSVAPMMEYTDRHQRTLMRLISKRAVLYTEMVTSQALVYSKKVDYLLNASFPTEEPLVLQLGGSDPHLCREAAKMAKEYGYKEINLNVGCPSDKVADAGCFGAALMEKPHLVAEIMLHMNDEMMKGNSDGCRPCTVKCRIGIDDQDDYCHVYNFVQTVHDQAQVRHFIIHARKAILGGRLSPDENRKIPPLKYDYVYRLAQDFPHIQFTINGGITTYEQIKEHLQGGVHGVMVGRQVVNTPYYWRNVDSVLYDCPDPGMNTVMISELSY